MFPLEPDEDGDGTFDEADGCPHIANARSADRDDDGIPDDCDLDPDTAGELKRFYSFHTSGVDFPTTTTGVANRVAAGIELGSPNGDENEASIDLLIPTAAFDSYVEVGLTILEHADPADAFVEIGVFTGHQSFEDSLQGDVCFLGRANDTPAEPNFLDVETLGNATRSTFGGAFIGRPSRLKQIRFKNQVSCTATQGDDDVGVDRNAVTANNGAITIATTRVKARIDYVWVVWRETRTSLP